MRQAPEKSTAENTSDGASVLEYGIGGGSAGALSERDGRTIVRFDPTSRTLEKKPAEKFDAVVFTHGLEAVPNADLPWLIESLFQHARHALHVAIDEDDAGSDGRAT